MQYWKAHYKDALHDTDIEIRNTEEDYNTAPLSFVLDGITFKGTSPGDFHLADAAQYEEADKKFSLLKWGGHHSGYQIISPYVYDLQRYELEVRIPVSVFRKRDRQLVEGNLFLAFRYVEPDSGTSHSTLLCDDRKVYRDHPEVSEFSFYVDEKLYKSTKKTLWFELALHDICVQIQNDYALRCCFTCQYSDYSPYGSDDYGLMLCFCRHKEECLKVNSKDDFFTWLEGKDYDGRQETYLCSQYSPRKRTGGYRGYVVGIRGGQDFEENNG